MREHFKERGDTREIKNLSFINLDSKFYIGFQET
jgi:hypothetical protein